MNISNMSNKESNQNVLPITEKFNKAFKKINIIAQEQGKNLSASVRNASDRVATGVRGTTNAIQSASNDSDVLRQIKLSGDVVGEFTAKNETVSKFVFVVFIFILFGLLIRLGIYILTYLLGPNKNPIVVNGSLNTTSLNIYPVNPTHAISNPILRSINENQGIEFTWNTWIYIDDPVTGVSSAVPKRFFSKGGGSKTGINFGMNSPGLYLWDGVSSHTNTITIAMNTFSKGDNIKEIRIKNIPIQKWVNVTIRVQNRIIDIYINGILSKRLNISEVVKQNYGDIYVGDSMSGPVGLISSLRYYNHAIGNNEIQSIVENGPNLKMVGNSHEETTPPYLASRWYLDSVKT